MDRWKKDYIKAHLSGDMNEARKALDLKKQHLPARVYRYRRFDDNGLNLRSIRENEIWLSRALDLNDPFECGLTVDYTELDRKLMPRALARLADKLDLPEPARTHVLESRSWDELMERVVSHSPGNDAEKAKKLEALRAVSEESQRLPALQLRHFFQQGTKIACFTTRHDSMPMWAHYAENHGGFCIEYATADFPDQHWKNLHPVLYSDSRVDFTPWLEPGQHSRFVAIVAASHKATEWSYEDEWRLVAPDGSEDKGILWHMPKPTALYFSHGIKAANKAALIDTSVSCGIPFFEMKLHETRYSLVPRPV